MIPTAAGTGGAGGEGRGEGRGNNNLDILRSLLQYYYPNDYKNLTINDLKSCKWKLLSQIFTNIINTSTFLLKYQEILNKIENNKLLQLDNIKNQTNLRENKKKIEEEYKYEFFQLILEICVDFNYPPVMEPFSNPLQSLYEDPEYILNIVSYFLEIFVVPNSSLRPLHNVRGHEVQNVILTPSTPLKNSNMGENKTTPRKSPVSKPIKAPTSHGIEEKIPQLETQSSVPVKTLGDYEALFQAFQILQHHNQQVTKQLKNLQDSIVARDESERNIDLLMRDIQLAITDIADIGIASGASSSLTEPNEPSVVTTESRRSQNSTISTKRESTKKSQSIGWVSVQNRFKELYSKWTEARRNAKTAVFGDISVHPQVNVGSNFMKASNSGFNQSHGDLSSRATTAKRPPSKLSSRAVKSAPISRATEDRSPSTVKLSQILGVFPPQSVGRPHSEVNDSLFTIALDLPRVHLLQQDLVNFSRTAFEFASLLRSLSVTFPPTSNFDSNNRSGINLSLSEITEDISYNVDDSLHSVQSTLPLTKKPIQTDQSSIHVDTHTLVSYEEQVNFLRMHARNLLLHVSCMAPLAPLSMGKAQDRNILASVGFTMPLSSSQTGLDILIEMITELLEPRKLLSPAIQRVIDRSKSEQFNLLNCIQQTEQSVQQWIKLSKESQNMLRDFTKSITDTFRECLKEIQTLQNSVNILLQAWYKCNQARISIPSTDSRSSSQLVSPIDMLCRGYLGEDMATLINTFKLYENNYHNLTNQLSNIQKQLHHEFNVTIIQSILNCYQKFSSQ